MLSLLDLSGAAPVEMDSFSGIIVNNFVCIHQIWNLARALEECAMFVFKEGGV